MKKRTEHDMFGPQPLPPHFGEIDVAARFDAKRFYTVLRCSGMNPMAVRQENGSVSLQLSFGGRTALQRKRISASHVWAATKDVGGRKQVAYARKILGSREFIWLG
jgi:hypothetical protein